MYELRYRLESGGISHFLNEAKFINKATGKESRGYINSGIGSQGEIDGNMGFLTRIQSEMALADSKVYKTLVTSSQERVRQLRLQNLSDQEFTMALAEEETKFRRQLKSQGLDESLPLPSHFLNDETSGVGNETYSNQVGKANKIFDIVNVEQDFITKLRAAKSKLMQLKGFPPTSNELAEEMKITKEEIDELLSCELRSITVSLQGTVKSKSDPSELVDILPSDQTPPMELAESAERTASAWTLLDKANLTEKERRIVSLRFGLDGSNEWRTLAEVARHMNCSREYCRQVVQRALRKLRKAGIQNGLVDSIS